MSFLNNILQLRKPKMIAVRMALLHALLVSSLHGGKETFTHIQNLLRDGISCRINITSMIKITRILHVFKQLLLRGMSVRFHVISANAKKVDADCSLFHLTHFNILIYT